MSSMLEIPRSCEQDPNSVELASVWHCGSQYVIVIQIGFFEANGVDEAVAWGQILADTANKILGQESAAGALLENVLDLVRRELKSPTSNRKGDFAPEAP
jgi:Domain of unknown function (DUF5076)